VNNAGIFETKFFLEVDEAYLDRFLNTNFKGTFFHYPGCYCANAETKGRSSDQYCTPLVNRGIGGISATAPLSSKGLFIINDTTAPSWLAQYQVNTIAPEQFVHHAW